MDLTPEQIKEYERIEQAAIVLVDEMDGITSDPWDNPGFRSAINEMSAALNRKPVGIDEPES